MIKLVTSFFLIIFLVSCKIQQTDQILDIIPDKETIKKAVKIPEKKVLKKSTDELNQKKSNLIKYHIGDPYFIEGVEYIPEENYNYDEIGLASFYGKELHKRKTINNDFNNVTELLGRHKTLPIPSIVKVTNLDNGLSLTIKINDRHDDNSSLIQVSRKTAQLLRFYKDKITKVRIEVLSDPSKQMKIVTQSMNEINFNDTIDSKDLTICAGPPGSGKTFVAVHYALRALTDKNSSYDGIIITKPLVEANGEKLGFLPGDISEKTEPFMMSYYYNMEQVIGKHRLDGLLGSGTIQVVPMAYMRGITFDRKIVILDEGQNASPEQIKMFLTRIGAYSKYIICGDLNQTDVKGTNGLADAVHRFYDMDEVGICSFDKADIVRHNLIGKLLDRYEHEDSINVFARMNMEAQKNSLEAQRA